MRLFLIISVLVLSLFACEKGKSELTQTDVMVTNVDSLNAIEVPDVVTPTDATASVTEDVTPVSSADIGVSD